MEWLRRIRNNPWYIFSSLGGHGLLNWMPDEIYLKLAYRGFLGEKLDLENPKTFNEKLQWLKIHDRNPFYSTLVDKYRVKAWVAEQIGVEHVVSTYGCWDRVEDINLDSLPDKFVLKTNHDSGGVVICRNKDTFDSKAAKLKLSKHLKNNMYWYAREWPYKDVTPLIFAEEFLEPNEISTGYCAAESDCCPADYKVSCFAGKPKLVEVHRGRFTQHTCDYYTPDWEPITSIDWGGVPFSDDGVEPPECLDEMLRLSSILVEGFPQARVDWYVVNNRLLFGEITFFSGAGFDPLDKNSDELLGSWIDLNYSFDRQRMLNNE